MAVDIQELVRVAEEAGYVTEVVDNSVNIMSNGAVVYIATPRVGDDLIKLHIVNHDATMFISFARYVMFVEM